MTQFRLDADPTPASLVRVSVLRSAHSKRGSVGPARAALLPCHLPGLREVYFKASRQVFLLLLLIS